MTHSDEKVLTEEVSAKGWHRVEIIRFGREVEVDAWAARLVPEVSASTWCFHPWVEKELNLHHVNIFWRERGAVDWSQWGALHAMPLQFGILYWMEPGERLSLAADVAATLHFRSYGRMPSHAWVRNVPAGHDRIDVGEGKNQTVLQLEAGEWVPAGFVVVGFISRQDAKDAKKTLENNLEVMNGKFQRRTNFILR
jgi:hypothetical protein